MRSYSTMIVIGICLEGAIGIFSETNILFLLKKNPLITYKKTMASHSETCGVGKLICQPCIQIDYKKTKVITKGPRNSDNKETGTSL